MSARDAVVSALIIWAGLIIGVVLMVVVLAERPDLRIRRWKIRRHNARRRGTVQVSITGDASALEEGLRGGRPLPQPTRQREREPRG